MRPEKSITGHPTVDVSNADKQHYLDDLMEKGIRLFRPQASELWALTQTCQELNLPYEVVSIADDTGTVRAVAVTRAQSKVLHDAPDAWKIETLETFAGINQDFDEVVNALLANQGLSLTPKQDAAPNDGIDYQSGHTPLPLIRPKQGVSLPILNIGRTKKDEPKP